MVKYNEKNWYILINITYLLNVIRKNVATAARELSGSVWAGATCPWSDGRSQQCLGEPPGCPQIVRLYTYCSSTIERKGQLYSLLLRTLVRPHSCTSIRALWGTEGGGGSKLWARDNMSPGSHVKLSLLLLQKSPILTDILSTMHDKILSTFIRSSQFWKRFPQDQYRLPWQIGTTTVSRSPKRPNTKRNERGNKAGSRPICHE